MKEYNWFRLHLGKGKDDDGYSIHVTSFLDDQGFSDNFPYSTSFFNASSTLKLAIVSSFELLTFSQQSSNGQCALS